MKTLNGKYKPASSGYVDLQFNDNQIFTEVKTYHVTKVCDVCFDGLMEFTGMCKLSKPSKWEHKCSNCGVVKDLDERFPCEKTTQIK